MSENRALVLKSGKVQDQPKGDVLFSIPSLPLAAEANITIPVTRVGILPTNFDVGTFRITVNGRLNILD